MCILIRFSHVWLFATLWTITHQASLSMGFSRQEYWSGLSCSPPGDLPNPGIDPASLVSPALAGRFFTISVTWEAQRTWVPSQIPGISWNPGRVLSPSFPTFLPKAVCWSDSWGRGGGRVALMALEYHLSHRKVQHPGRVSGGWNFFFIRTFWGKNQIAQLIRYFKTL